MPRWTIARALVDRLAVVRSRRREVRFLQSGLARALAEQKSRLHSRLSGHRPRVAIVKQDCNEDLYCCPPDSDVWTTISSTLLRSGPVDLFTLFDARFILLQTEPDPECSIWQEKADCLKWAPRSWFESFRDHIPGRDHGQSAYAQAVEEVDWSAFDLVVSIDVSVPSRITRKYPRVVWSYYVREIKAPSWHASLVTPIEGQDLFLSQRFPLLPDARAEHVVDFPYHFQHVGVFHELAVGADVRPDDEPRAGVFVEYHSAREATDEQLRALSAFGPVYSHRVVDEKHDAVTGDRIPDCTMSGRALTALLRSKYHVKWCGRPAFGTAKVEAVAAGCVCLTDPALDSTPFLHSRDSLAGGFDAMLGQLHNMEAEPDRYRRELARQRQLIDYLCYYRPANDLLDACQRVLASRPKGKR